MTVAIIGVITAIAVPTYTQIRIRNYEQAISSTLRTVEQQAHVLGATLYEHGGGLGRHQG